jgi:CubicO group peptidase (beta-lactamase class C family)
MTNVPGGAATTSDGGTHPDFTPVRSAFDDLVRARPAYGAALAVYRDGVPVVDLWGGTYRRESLQLVWSSTKATLGVVAAMLAERGALDLDAPVASVWPEFASAGKTRLPIRLVLSHQAGLPTVDRAITLRDVVEGEPLLRALELQRPLWEPGSAHGYHALTIGTIFGEIVRRVTGRSFGRYFREEVAEPLGLDFWIGLPEALEGRVASIKVDDRSATATVSPAVDTARADPMSLHSRVFSRPTLVPLEWNARDVHAAEIPAANGICSARAIARLYAACIGPVDGLRLFGERTLSEVTRPHAEGFDLVTLETTRFGLAFALPFPRLPFGGDGAFGHDGLGGSLGLADPKLGIALGFTTDLVPELTGADPAIWPIVEAVRDCMGA